MLGLSKKETEKKQQLATGFTTTSRKAQYGNYIKKNIILFYYNLFNEKEYVPYHN